MKSVRAFKTRTFARWMRKAGLFDRDLCRAIDEMRRGLIDADLGGYVVKKRVALAGQGKRSGARTIVATRLQGRWFFLFGFSKNERANIDQSELKFLQEIASDLLAFDEQQLQVAISCGELVEVFDDREKK